MSEEKNLADLQSQLDAIQSEQTELAAEIAKLPALPTRFDGSTELPTDRPASQATPEEIERAQVVRDPWAGRNALQILKHPPGKRLQWISPEYRKRRGMRGWAAVQHDDAIGRELHLYINDPPSRMEGLADIGTVVRRGDVVLAWIDEGIFRARLRQGQDKANRRLADGATRGNSPIGKHGRTIGQGLSDDADSKYRRAKPAPGFISPRRLAEYRAAAVGTAEDGRIAVEGRRLFDAEPDQTQE